MMILRYVVLFVGVLCVLSSGQTPYRCSDAVYTRPDPGQKSWNDAQSVCRQSRATLPIVSDQQRQSCFAMALKNFNVNTSGESVWIGANTSGDLGLWRWVDGSQYSRTDNPIPNGTYQGDYAYIDIDKDSNMKIFSTRPTVNLPFICRYNGTDYGTCSSTLHGFYDGGICFVTNESKVSWFSARYSCLQSKGDLAFFNDIFVFDGIVKYAYWIGLRRNTWNWNNAVNGSTMDMTYTLWSSGQPDGNGSQCISTDTSSGDGVNWRDSNCNDIASFICQGFSLDQVPPFSPPSATSSSMGQVPPSSSTPATSSSMGQVPPSSSTSATSSSMGQVPPSSSSPATGSSMGQVPPSYSSMVTSSSTIFPTPAASSEPGDNGASESKDGGVNRSLLTALGVGIGVGLGVPFLIGLIALIIVIVICWRRHRKSKTKPKPAASKKKNKEDVELNDSSSSSAPHEESFGTVNKANHEQISPEVETSLQAIPLYAESNGTVSKGHHEELSPYTNAEEHTEFAAPLESEALPNLPNDEDYGFDNEGGPPFYPTEENPEFDTSSPPSFPQEISEEQYGVGSYENHDQLEPPSPRETSNLPPFPEDTPEDHYGVVDNENHEQSDPFTPYEPSDSTANYAEFNFNDT